MDKVQAFDIPVDNMERAKRFYEKVFGWEIAPVPGSGGNFHSATTVPVDEEGEPKVLGGINGGFFQRGTHNAQETFVEINVSSVDAYLKRIESAGGKIIKQKSSILDIAFFALVKDTEGNIIGLWEDIKK